MVALRRCAAGLGQRSEWGRTGWVETGSGLEWIE